MVSPYKIKYDGIFSDELNMPDLIMDVAVDGDNGETQTYLNREAVSSESHDGRYKRIHKFKYTETFSPKFTFFKKNFSEFSMEDVRAVLKWLTHKDSTALLEVYYDDSNVVSWASIGGFVELQTYKIANNRTIAITATWDSISPFAMSDLYTVPKTISSAEDNKITIEIDTDDNKPVYPRITINHGYGTTTTPHTVVDITGAAPFNNILDMTDYVENTIYKNDSTYYWKTSEPTFMSASTAPEYEGWTTVTATRAYTAEDTFESNTFYKYNNTYYWLDPYAFHSSNNQPSINTTSVKITNQHYDFFGKPSDKVVTIVKNNTGTEKIVLDCANKIVSSDRTKRIFGDDFNWQWLELYDGKNEITIEGNCEVTLSWIEARKVGEY